ncbi:MAG TPA: hypothetical protein VIG94_08025 [Faecalibacter sp.]
MKTKQLVFASSKKLNEFQLFSIFNILLVVLFLIDICLLKPNERTEKIAFVHTQYDHQRRGIMKAFDVIYTENDQKILLDRFPKEILNLPEGTPFTLHQSKIFHKILFVSFQDTTEPTSISTKESIIWLLIGCMFIQLCSIFFHHRFIDTITALSIFPIYYFIVFVEISKWIFLNF